MDIDPDFDCEQTAAESSAEKRMTRRNAAHPDCRDPDHEGCERCLYDDDAGSDDGK